MLSFETNMNPLPLLLSLLCLLITSCSTVFLDKPIGTLVSSTEFDAFGIYVDGKGNRYEIAPTDEEHEFAITELSDKATNTTKTRITTISEDKVQLAWFLDHASKRWALTRIIPNMDGGFCLLMPNIESLQALARRGKIKVEKEDRDMTYRVFGDINEEQLANDSLWSFNAVRCYFKESDLRKRVQ